jgi:O-antigen biosynthesis protein
MTRPDEAAPRASIIIVCHKRIDLLADSLGAVRNSLSGEVSAEIILLFNGTPEADRERVRPFFGDARVIVSEVNLGFGGGNNRAAALARGEYLVMLNDDAEPRAGWLEALVGTGDRDENVGAVGSRIVLPGGMLQEAGDLIWSDGSTLGVGRGLPADSHRYEYLREVDYVSACSLLVRRSTFERLGGFDERYFPAYNEDVDLCLGIRSLGQRVLYQPRSVVVHHESQTGGAEARTFLILRGRGLLRDKWGAYLERFPDPAPLDPTAIELAVHHAMGSPRRLLIIDDRIPERGGGSGFGRMLDAIRELAGAGYAVSMYPTATGAGDRRELQDLGVDIVGGELTPHLAAPATWYDVAIVSRPHNFPTVRLLRRYQRQCAVIYDAEALFHRRLVREAELLAPVDAEAAEQTLVRARQALRLERRVVRRADRVVSVSKVEAQVLRSFPGHAPVDVIEPLTPDVRMTSGRFADRNGMLLVAGWLAGYPSPNSDGLEWFLENVLPAIKERLPWARLSVTGRNPPKELIPRAGASLQFLGHVDDLRDVYDRARVAIVPVRYGAGIKLKALEALQYGLPVVTTSVGAEGIEGAGGAAVSVCDDAHQFADRTMALLDEKHAWEEARTAIAELHAQWDGKIRGSWATSVEAALRKKNWLHHRAIAPTSAWTR